MYVIDIGAQDTLGNTSLQGPFDRVSEPLSKNNVTYRLIEKDLVYFSSSLKQNFSKVRIELRFLDTIPQGYELNIGLKDKKEWSYIWKTVYSPFYKSLEAFNLTGDNSDFRIYSLRNNLTMPVSSFLNSPPEGSIIAIDELADVKINTRPDSNYVKSNSDISELRGDHTFYIYTRGYLSLSVNKQDLNWYNGTDALEIKLYSRANTTIKNITISDDGNTGSNKDPGMLQNGTLDAVLKEGVYRVTMTGGSDFLIRSIKLNSGSIIVQNPYLAGILYTNATVFNLYTKALRGDRIKFRTQHADGLQIVNISSNSYTKSLNINAINEWYYIDLPPSSGLYDIYIPKGDITVNADGYFSFSNHSYFNLTVVKTLPQQNIMEWLNKNRVDYVIVPKIQVIKDGDWIIASAEYNLSDAYIENNALSFVISAPHLKNYNYSIPLDWIKIHMEK